MFTENGLTVDRAAVDDVLRRADLLTIGFTTFPERLLVDVRSNTQAGPLVAVVAPVATVQERYAWLGQHRGMFGPPEAFSFFIWPHTVRMLVSRDVLAIMRDRLNAVSGESAADLDTVLRQLLAAEREAMRGAVRGSDAFQTLWERVA
jgi:hypothetical protein